MPKPSARHKHTASYGSVVSFADHLEIPSSDKNPSPASQQNDTGSKRRTGGRKEEEYPLIRDEVTLPLHKVVEDIKVGKFQRHTSDPISQDQRNNSDPIRRDSVNGSSGRPQSVSEYSIRSDSVLPPNIFSTEDDDDGIFPSFHHHWLPDSYETELIDGRPLQSSQSTTPVPRSLKRRVFLFLTEPTTSIGAAVFFFVLIFAIALMNILMIMQTMNHWQFTPDDCITCGGTVEYIFEDDAIEAPLKANVPCVCPPTPVGWTNTCLTYLVYFFSVEWTLRVVLFEPSKDSLQEQSFWAQWYSYITDPTTILDALAIFPYYAETLDNTNGLMSLRLLRLFRVFQLLRLGQYNTTFLSLTNVLRQAMLYLKLLIIALIFGAALFGSLMYWLEKGSWKYHEESGQYRFMRLSVDGVTEEPSPFTSIPAAFWWFIVTATTCGYGDVYPTTTGGKWVAVVAMLLGVLVVAFPVSVFSDLWSNEVSKINRRYYGHDDALLSTGNAKDNNIHHDNSNDDDSYSDIYHSTKAKDVEALLSSFRMSPALPRPPSPPSNPDDTGGTTERKYFPSGKSPRFGSSERSYFPPVKSPGTLSSLSENRSHDEDFVQVKQQDLTTILTELSTIRESEFRIRSVLNKYNIQTES